VARLPPKYPAVDLGQLPVGIINAVLGTELEPGRVRLSEQAHRHMAEDHPDDYAVCFPVLAAAIATPTFIGQAPCQPTTSRCCAGSTTRPERWFWLRSAWRWTTPAPIASEAATWWLGNGSTSAAEVAG
jgi:hypothetical protein